MAADRTVSAPDIPRKSWAISLGILAVAAQLILVWGFEFFPSIDGPAHVHLAHAMFEALQGDPFYSGLVEVNSKFNPNIATQGVLVALMAIAAPVTAEKIWLTLYFISFAAAAAYSLSGIGKASLCLLPLMLFCSISFPLAFGFYNFSFSAVVFLAWFSYWWRNRRTFSLRVVAGHAAFAALAYATHLFALVVTLLAIGLSGFAAICVEVFRKRTGRDDGAIPSGLGALISHAIPPFLGSLPELAACAHFLLVRFGTRTSAGASRLGDSDPLRLHELLTGTSFSPYDSKESFAVAAFLCFVLLLAAGLLRSSKPTVKSVPLAVCLAGFVATYLVMPSQWIVRWMPDRFQPMVFVVLLLCIATLLPENLRRSRWVAISASGILILIFSVVIRFQVFGRIDGFYQELASIAPHIRKESTLIGLRLHTWLGSQPFPSKLDVFIQSGSRIALMRHSVDLKNFQGQSNDHPFQFRPGISATPALGGDPAITATPPRLNLMAYEEQSGRPIDYVYFYGYRDSVADKKALARLDQQLTGNYRLAFVSQPSGLVHLYARTRNTGSAEFDTSDPRPR